MKQDHYNRISAILALCERAAKDMDEYQQAMLIILINNRFDQINVEKDTKVEEDVIPSLTLVKDNDE